MKKVKKSTHLSLSNLLRELFFRLAWLCGLLLIFLLIVVVSIPAILLDSGKVRKVKVNLL